jgi:hypothetical protein
MSPAAHTHAVVSLPLLDVRREPRHAAELGSQLLMGETVSLLGPGPRAGWLRVRNDADGYRGWVRAWGLVTAGRARVAGWRRRARARVAAPMASVLAAPRAGTAVSPVFFGNRLIAGPVRRGWRRVELPDGRCGWLPAATLAGTRAPGLAERVKTLLGAPYLWGGRSPAGFDCSGFVQQVLLEQGRSLPRDARHQCAACRRLPGREQPAVGDLAFFRRPGEPASHVGIGLGAGYYAHCRGRVAIASIEAGNPLYDNDLAPQFMGWYRPGKLLRA